MSKAAPCSLHQGARGIFMCEWYTRGVTGGPHYGYDLGFGGHSLCQYTVVAAADPASASYWVYRSPSRIGC